MQKREFQSSFHLGARGVKGQPKISKPTTSQAVAATNKQATTATGNTAAAKANTTVIGEKSTNFRMTDNLSGAQSSETVGRNIAILRSGGSLQPIKVAQINDKLYVLDGHHRVEASIRSQTNLRYEVVPPSGYHTYGFMETMKNQ